MARVKQMTDTELVEYASEFREGILDGRPSAWMCGMVCYPLAGLLEMCGVKVEVVESDLGHCNHVWMRLEDGRALDPTADQFNVLFPDLAMPAVYLGPPAKIHGTD